MRPALGVAVAAAFMGCDAPRGASPTPQPSAAASAIVTAAGSAASAAPVAAPASAPAAAPAPETIIAQHVLVTYRGAKRAPKTVTRTKAEAKARAAEALGKLRAGTAFEEVVKTYSDDAATLERMGSLGKFRRDAMDPAFASAAFALAVGAVSDVVETPFGFHVIRRTQ
jgi:hypothetical protein